MDNTNNEDAAVIQRILGPLQGRVSFRYPRHEGDKEGFLKDRVVMRSNPDSAGVPYWDVVDLIEFPGEPEPEWIRIGYYRKPRERLVYASQTTITEPISVWRRLLAQAAREKPWFRRLLDDVMMELQTRGER